MVDREQIRRDAETYVADDPLFAPRAPAEELARHCLVLLAESQAYREAAERRQSAFIAAEARLAKVTALVEAIQQCFGTWPDNGRLYVIAGAEDVLYETVKPALAAWLES